MRYRVHGTSRMTGAPATLLVEAKNHEAARALASRHLVVGQVEPEGGLAEPEVFEPPEKSEMEQLIAAVTPENRGGGAARDGLRPKLHRRRRLLIALGLALVLVLAIVLLAIWSKLPHGSQDLEPDRVGPVAPNVRNFGPSGPTASIRPGSKTD